jgi:hypothetical protein
MHLSYRIASTGGGAGRDDAADFREVVRGEHNLGHWPSDRELSEGGVLPVRHYFKRRAQSEVLLEIGAVEARQLRANVVCFHFLNLRRLGAQQLPSGDLHCTDTWR